MNVVAVHYVLATHGWSPRERLTRYPEYPRFRKHLDDDGGGDADAASRSWHG